MYRPVGSSEDLDATGLLDLGDLPPFMGELFREAIDIRLEQFRSPWDAYRLIRYDKELQTAMAFDLLDGPSYLGEPITAPVELRFGAMYGEYATLDSWHAQCDEWTQSGSIPPCDRPELIPILSHLSAMLYWEHSSLWGEGDAESAMLSALGLSQKSPAADRLLAIQAFVSPAATTVDPYWFGMMLAEWLVMGDDARPAAASLGEAVALSGLSAFVSTPDQRRLSNAIEHAITVTAATSRWPHLSELAERWMTPPMAYPYTEFTDNGEAISTVLTLEAEPMGGRHLLQHLTAHGFVEIDVNAESTDLELGAALAGWEISSVATQWLRLTGPDGPVIEIDLDEVGRWLAFDDDTVIVRADVKVDEGFNISAVGRVGLSSGLLERLRYTARDHRATAWLDMTSKVGGRRLPSGVPVNEVNELQALGLISLEALPAFHQARIREAWALRMARFPTPIDLLLELSVSDSENSPVYDVPAMDERLGRDAALRFGKSSLDLVPDELSWTSWLDENQLSSTLRPDLQIYVQAACRVFVTSMAVVIDFPALLRSALGASDDLSDEEVAAWLSELDDVPDAVPDHIEGLPASSIWIVEAAMVEVLINGAFADEFSLAIGELVEHRLNGESSGEMTYEMARNNAEYLVSLTPSDKRPVRLRDFGTEFLCPPAAGRGFRTLVDLGDDNNGPEVTLVVMIEPDEALRIIPRCVELGMQSISDVADEGMPVDEPVPLAGWRTVLSNRRLDISCPDGRLISTFFTDTGDDLEAAIVLDELRTAQAVWVVVVPGVDDRFSPEDLAQDSQAVIGLIHCYREVDADPDD